MTEHTQEQVTELPDHPCYIGNGEYDHNWEFQDDSFDHEFGCQMVHYYRCSDCDETKDCDDD